MLKEELANFYSFVFIHTKIKLCTELKPLEWDIPNHDCLIWLYVHTFDFLLMILFLDISTVWKLRLITITDTLLFKLDLYPIDLKSAVHKPAFRTFKQI